MLIDYLLSFTHRTILLKQDKVLDDLKHRFRCSRVAIKSHINDDNFRSPNVRILGPESDEEKDPWVIQVDNGIKYCFNIQRSMFCKGMANLRFDHLPESMD